MLHINSMLYIYNILFFILRVTHICNKVLYNTSPFLQQTDLESLKQFVILWRRVTHYNVVKAINQSINKCICCTGETCLQYFLFASVIFNNTMVCRRDKMASIYHRFWYIVVQIFHHTISCYPSERLTR